MLSDNKLATIEHDLVLGNYDQPIDYETDMWQLLLTIKELKADILRHQQLIDMDVAHQKKYSAKMSVFEED